MEEMNRRKFLKYSTVSLSALTLEVLMPEVAQAERNDVGFIQKNGLSILQGLTTETTTQLSVDVPKGLKLNYELIDLATGQPQTPYYFKTATRDDVKWQVDKVGYKDLPALGEFKFRVLDSKGFVLDERFLKLLDLNKTNARVAFLSCINDDNDDLKKSWAAVEKANPDLLFFIGDACYGDILAFFHGPDLLWNRYIESRQKLSYYHWKNLKPAICIWDDHDFGVNNADGTYKHKQSSLATFRAFTAQESLDVNFENGPGAASFLRAFGYKFILLDNRYFKNLTYNNIKGFLGYQQIDWAFKKLSQGTEPNFIIEGSQFYGGFRKGGESYRLDSPEEMEFFNRNVRDLNSPSVFVAGDVHYSEVFSIPKEKVGYQTYEITSSGLHAATRRKPPQNPNRVFVGEQENFIFADLNSKNEGFSFDLTGVGISNVNFKGSLNIG